MSYWSKIYYAEMLEVFARVEGDALVFGQRDPSGEQIRARVPLHEVLDHPELEGPIRGELGDEAWAQISARARALP